MDNIQLFTNQLFGNVNVFEINGEIWFIGKEIANILGYKDTDQAIRDHVYIDDKMLINGQFFKPVELTGLNFNIPNRGLIIINESGLYSLIFGSKLPAAIEFKHWVTHEVLPAMRKIGFNESMNILQNKVRELEAINGNLNSEVIRLQNKDLTVGVDHAFVSAQYCQMREKLEHLVNNNIPIDRNNLEFILRYDEGWGEN